MVRIYFFIISIFKLADPNSLRSGKRSFLFTFTRRLTESTETYDITKC